MIFVDTGPFLARYLSDDSLHARASRTWKDLERRNSAICTSNFVLDETLTLLARRADYRFAAERGRRIYASEALRIFRADEAVENLAGMNADPDLAGNIAVSSTELGRVADRFQNCQGGTDGFLGVLRVRFRAAEYGEEGVADKFIHRSVVSKNRFNERLKIVIEHVHYIMGIHLR